MVLRQWCINFPKAAVLQQGACARPGSTSTKLLREMLLEGRLLGLKTIRISIDVLVPFYNLSEFECNLLSVEDGRGMLRYASWSQVPWKQHAADRVGSTSREINWGWLLQLVLHTSVWSVLDQRLPFKEKELEKKNYYCFPAVSEIDRCPQNVLHTHAITSQDRFQVPRASRWAPHETVSQSKLWDEKREMRPRATVQSPGQRLHILNLRGLDFFQYGGRMDWALICWPRTPTKAIFRDT